MPAPKNSIDCQKSLRQLGIASSEIESYKFATLEIAAAQKIHDAYYSQHEDFKKRCRKLPSNLRPKLSKEWTYGKLLEKLEQVDDAEHHVILKKLARSHPGLNIVKTLKQNLQQSTNMNPATKTECKQKIKHVQANPSIFLRIERHIDRLGRAKSKPELARAKKEAFELLYENLLTMSPQHAKEFFNGWLVDNKTCLQTHRDRFFHPWNTESIKITNEIKKSLSA